MYQNRLAEYRKRVLVSCNKRWDDGFRLQGKPVVHKKRVLDIQAGQPCWCIGAVYCEMKYKPNILDEVSSDTYGSVEPADKYTDPEGTDNVMLEDESGRVLLVGDLIKTSPFITGTVLGFLGMEAEPGTFQVLDICYPEALPQAPRKAIEGKKLALVSGLNFCVDNPTLSFKAKLLQEVVAGDIGRAEKMVNVCRFLICGDSVNYKEDGSDIHGALEGLGAFLVNILKSVPVTILPGASDPTERSLPQQALNKALFKQTLKPFFAKVRCELFETVTNPYWFDCEGIQILVTSGQTIDDISKYVVETTRAENSVQEEIEHRLDLMEATLKWQNVAPTAPDTLWCFPYKENDPFVLKQLPHVYIVGNQPGFGFRKASVEGGSQVVLVTLPKFSETGSFATLDLGTLDTEIFTIEY
ncbi:HHR042Cp [Eremothecium sinecaudum]|uniref:DNA-directed DNA polymerase n=1 Tax=Eremothecium sinecaudum TaxID=45286 RepID=A0A0X8HW52_9SACH|nr:HHR042Cp [Eremothecium sinecaudum]AMD22811.1 HHR042Cp [Eremothecium sinecaudum]